MSRPGQNYTGTSRHVYLPDDAVGWRAYALLKKAFETGHLFVVGDSITTSQRDVVVWGSIHQKTSRHGGTIHHGWPDPAYIGRLVSECAVHGIGDLDGVASDMEVERR